MTINRLWRFLALGTLLVGIALTADAASTAISKGSRVNVRSRPGFTGEVITQLDRGQKVEILETITLSQPAPDEPPAWLKIRLPAGTPIWVASEYIDTTAKTVRADVLNARAGPSYDHAVVARLPQGTAVQLTGQQGDGWLQIIAPPDAEGYVPTLWVAIEEGADESPMVPVTTTPSATTTPQPPGTEPTSASSASPDQEMVPITPTPSPETPTTTAIPETLPMEEPKDRAWFEQFVTSSTRPSTTAPPSVRSEPLPPLPASVADEPPATPAVSPATEPEVTAFDDLDAGTPQVLETLGQGEARRVRREGIIVRPINIQAPSFYGLQSRDSRKIVNFLYTSPPQAINWRDYRGKVVIVVGREYLDERYYWRGVPLLNVEEIEAVR